MAKATIHFCVMWDYRPQAARVAGELTKQGLEVGLIEGSRGIFDVKVDGKLIFSKYETGRFPEAGEITRLLKP